MRSALPSGGNLGGRRCFDGGVRFINRVVVAFSLLEPRFCDGQEESAFETILFAVVTNGRLLRTKSIACKLRVVIETH
jgi:hypothetical protein